MPLVAIGNRSVKPGLPEEQQAARGAHELPRESRGPVSKSATEGKYSCDRAAIPNRPEGIEPRSGRASRRSEGARPGRGRSRDIPGRHTAESRLDVVLVQRRALEAPGGRDQYSRTAYRGGGCAPGPTSSRFGPRWTTPQPSAGTEFCTKCIADPPPGPPRDTAAELNHVATLCQHAAKDFVRDRTASKIAASVAFDLLHDIMVREFPAALEGLGRRSGAVR